MRRLKLAIVFVAGLFGGITGAFASTAVYGCVNTGDDPEHGACDIIPSVVQVAPPAVGASAPSVAFSNGTQTNYVQYRVKLTHYADRPEGFSQVSFVADTSVVNASSPGPANFVAASPAVIANAGSAVLTNAASACVISSTHIECGFNFSPAFDGNLPQATISFDLTVQSPTGTANGAPQLLLASTTSWTEVDAPPVNERYVLLSASNLTTPDPKVVDTYVPVAGGKVTTGTNQGAATCSEPWVTIVKVPAPAQVGVNLNIGDETVPPGTLFFARISIPDLLDPLGNPQLFGVGTHWYDPGAASQLVVNTLRRDKCTIGSGTGSLSDAGLILKEKIYYKPDQPTTHNPIPEYRQVYLCLVTSGPYVGEPCIAFAQVYTKYNLPKNVTNPSEYLGDHEWVIFSNENGKVVTGN
jgi:hypothetical protein